MASSLEDELDSEWTNFIKNGNKQTEIKERKEIKMPECDPIKISTKTKIIYLNVELDLKRMFWCLPMIDYQDMKEGIIKKQIKFNFNTKEEVDEFEQNLSLEKRIHNVSILNQIDSPNGRVKFKDIRKIDIGICKNDLIKTKKKSKSAFYNCFVIIHRVRIDGVFREIHMKLFNTGKIEIPGIQNDEMVVSAVECLKILLQPYYEKTIIELIENRETILINSNFSCNYYINREQLFHILKTKYNVKCSYDPCSYPGIQCKYKIEQLEISFMIFRTGSVLIVGKCENEDLYVIYDFIKNIFKNEFMNVYEEVNEPKEKIKNKIKKIIYIEG
jgi:TATA-box binding protein (TBP) (component of TFIID and TFIIIB)